MPDFLPAFAFGVIVGVIFTLLVLAYLDYRGEE